MRGQSIRSTASTCHSLPGVPLYCMAYNTHAVAVTHATPGHVEYLSTTQSPALEHDVTVTFHTEGL